MASHWHDDHVRGISDLARYYPQAEFYLSAAFTEIEAAKFLAAYSGHTAPGQAKGTNELYTVIRQKESYVPVLKRSIIHELKAFSRNIRVLSFSPTQIAHAESTAILAQYIPTEPDTHPINHAPVMRPNNLAVVIHIDFDGDAALLGADLENHPSGWQAVVTNGWCNSKQKSSVYKVAHHGSISGDDLRIWENLLTDNPIACVTPFHRGRHRIPTENDLRRIKEVTSHAYLSSNTTRRPDMDSAILKRLGDICSNVARANPGFGAIRLRKKVDEHAWREQLFGTACRL